MRTFALLLLAAAAAAGDVEINEEWLAEDLAIAKKLRGLAPPGDAPLAAYLPRLGGSERVDRDIGFGGREVFRALHGGHATAWVRLVAFEGKVAWFELFFDVGPEWPRVKDRVAGAFGGLGGATADPHGFRVRWVHAARAAAYRAAIEKALGALPETPVPDELARDVAVLTDPLQSYPFGEMYGESGDPPRGHVAARRLRERGRADLLRRVLRGTHPEGRVYAADALFALATAGTPLAEADRAAIAKLRALKVPLERCRGCEVSTAFAAELLPPGPPKKKREAEAPR